MTARQFSAASGFCLEQALAITGWSLRAAANAMEQTQELTTILFNEGMIGANNFLGQTRELAVNFCLQMLHQDCNLLGI